MINFRTISLQSYICWVLKVVLFQINSIFAQNKKNYATYIDRFISYVTIDTESDSKSETTPSTAKQWDLANKLVEVKSHRYAGRHDR
jgi:hypothetical protein